MSTTYRQVGVRGTGRRKEAIARVRLLPGKGHIVINGKSAQEYLGGREAIYIPVYQALTAAGVEKQYNVVVRANGGGKMGQAVAIRLGIARALASMNKDLAVLMRKEGFLTRDPRVKERKKYGRKKARKRFQFSKR